MFWPPLLLDLLLLLLCHRRRRRRYYCCCCCCAVTRSCVRSIQHKMRNSLLRRGCAQRSIAGREASAAQQQHRSSTAAAQQQQQQRRRRRRRGSSSGQLPFGVSGWLLCCVSVAERVCALSVSTGASWLSLVALVARFRPRDKARSV